MSDIDVRIHEPLIDRDNVAEALEKCHDAIVKSGKGGLERFAWPLLKANVADAVTQSASGDKLQWLLKGWAFAKELQAYKDPAKYPPDKAVMLKLGEHKLSGTLHPEVTVSCDGAVIERLPFDVNLSAALNAVSISIKGGQIVACGGGECRPTLSIKFRDVDLTGPIELEPLQLPGKLEFSPPISIP